MEELLVLHHIVLYADWVSPGVVSFGGLVLARDASEEVHRQPSSSVRSCPVEDGFPVVWLHFRGPGVEIRGPFGNYSLVLFTCRTGNDRQKQILHKSCLFQTLTLNRRQSDF